MNLDAHRLSDLQARLASAQDLFGQHRLPEAIDALLKINDAFGVNVMASYMLGIAYLQSRDAVSAKTHLLACAKERPDWPPAWRALSVTHGMLGWVEEAVAAERRAVLLAPENLEACESLVRIAVVRTGLAEVHALAGHLCGINPGAAANWRGLVLAAICAGARPNNQLLDAARVSVLDTPDDVRMLSVISGQTLEIGDPRRAARAARQCRCLDPDDEHGLLALLAAVSRLGRVAEFMSLCFQGLDKAREPVAILNAVLIHAGELLKADAASVEAGPVATDAATRHGTALILDLAHDALHLDRLDDARSVIRLVRRTTPDDERAIELQRLTEQAGSDQSPDGIPKGTIPADRLAIHAAPRHAIKENLSTGDSLFAGVNVHVALERIHEILEPSVYLEVGLGSGEGLVLSRPDCHAIGIDPQPLRPLFEAYPHIRFYHGTSDAFFDRPDVMAQFGCRDVDLAFIDGMHLYEYVLRDFRNTERVMSPGGIVLLHDLLPPYAHWAGRDNVVGYPWAGDTWKFFRILAKYRPDLDISLLLAEPTGIGMVRGLDPANQILWTQEEEIIASVKEDRFDFDALWNQPGPEKIPLNRHTLRADLRNHIAP